MTAMISEPHIIEDLMTLLELKHVTSFCSCNNCTRDVDHENENQSSLGFPYVPWVCEVRMKDVKA